MTIRIFPILAAIAIAPAVTTAEAPAAAESIAKHRSGSEKIADEQDELSADVQQLVMEQTVPQVIELFKEVEDIMGEATELLIDHDTGGQTIAAQTEVIEKIHEAAKKRQEASGSGESGSAMMDMLERMMGQNPDGQGNEPKDGDGDGDADGETGGSGQTGDSNSANDAAGGANDGFTEERRVPKAAGSAGRALPPEFRSALEAYNRGMERLDRR